MGIKFVQTSDNKYVQWRLMKDTWSNLITDWQNMGDFLEEKEHPIADNEVAGYLTDKNKSVIAILMKSGAVEWLVENSKDIANNARFESIEDLLSYVSSEVPDSGNGVIKYLTDKNGVVIATINNVGDTEFKGGGGFDGEISKSRIVGFDAIKVLTSNNNAVIGWITNKGEVHIEELYVNKLKLKDNTDIGLPEQLFPLLGFMANGTQMKDFVNDKAYNLLFNSKGIYRKEGSHINLEPTIVIHDDDTIDNQIISSFNGLNPSSRTGGYASLLLPMIMSLNAKYGDIINAKDHKIIVGCAAEGQRIGLTPLYGNEDVFNGELNTNGKILQKIIEHEGWEALCHSMTARYYAGSYIVKGLNSNFANIVKNNGTVKSNYLSWENTCVYDTETQKNYYLKYDRSGWEDLPKHYIKPYLATYINVEGTDIINEDFIIDYNEGRKAFINPTYSVEYQVKTWFERAKIAGLSYIDAGINWGSSHSIWHMKESLKYCNFFFGRHGNYNTVPLDTNAIRSNSSGGLDGDDNVYTDDRYNKIIGIIDDCIENNGLMVFMNHANDTYLRNYYVSGSTYYSRTSPSEEGRLDYYDANYPESWIVPLRIEYLQDMLTNENSTYWTKPPLHKRNQDGILSEDMMDSWADWYPCPGTKIALIYDYLTYAIKKGIRFASSKEAISKFANVLSIGIKKEQGGGWTADSYLGNIPEQNKSYCCIGADGSIDYNSK